MDNIKEEDEKSSRMGSVTSMRNVQSVENAGEFGASSSKGGCE